MAVLAFGALKTILDVCFTWQYKHAILFQICGIRVKFLQWNKSNMDIKEKFERSFMSLSFSHFQLSKSSRLSQWLVFFTVYPTKIMSISCTPPKKSRLKKGHCQQVQTMLKTWNFENTPGCPYGFSSLRDRNLSDKHCDKYCIAKVPIAKAFENQNHKFSEHQRTPRKIFSNQKKSKRPLFSQFFWESFSNHWIFTPLQVY